MHRNCLQIDKCSKNEIALPKANQAKLLKKTLSGNQVQYQTDIVKGIDQISDHNESSDTEMKHDEIASDEKNEALDKWEIREGNNELEENEAAADELEGVLNFEFNMLINPTTGKIPEGVFESENLQASQIYESSSITNRESILSTYTFQGPDNLVGRTRTIAYDVRYNGTNNRIILAGGVSGGVYKSIDDGATWVQLFHKMTYLHFLLTASGGLVF